MSVDWGFGVILRKVAQEIPRINAVSAAVLPHNIDGIGTYGFNVLNVGGRRFKVLDRIKLH